MNMRSEAHDTPLLRDGRSVTIRSLCEADHDAMLAFGEQLPQDDWIYLEDDLHNPDIIRRLVNAAEAENWRQIVAVDPVGTVVGYGVVRRLPGWSNHVGDVQLIISADYRRSGLGTAMGGAIFAAARDLGVGKVIVEIMAEQVGGQAIFTRLGFAVEGRLSAHARDRQGHHHDLHVLAYHVA